MSKRRTSSSPRKCVLPLMRAAWLLACIALPACQTNPKTEPSIAVTSPILPAEEPRIIKTPGTVAHIIPAPFHSTDKTTVTQSEPANEKLELPVRPPPHIVVEPANPKIQTISYQSKTSGLVHALEEYLEHHNDEAVSILKRYPIEDQEFLLVVVPMIARIELGEAWSTLSPAQRLASLEILRDLVRRRSQSAPLVLAKVMFLDHLDQREMPHFGEVKTRANNIFRPGDWVYLYYEVLNLVDHLGEDDLYHLRLTITVQLCSQDGATVLGDTKEFPYTKDSKRSGSISQRTDFAFPAYFTVPITATPGSYQLNLIVTDMETGRQAKASLPLQVVERATKQSRKN